MAWHGMAWHGSIREHGDLHARNHIIINDSEAAHANRQGHEADCAAPEGSMRIIHIGSEDANQIIKPQGRA